MTDNKYIAELLEREEQLTGELRTLRWELKKTLEEAIACDQAGVSKMEQLELALAYRMGDSSVVIYGLGSDVGYRRVNILKESVTGHNNLILDDDLYVSIEESQITKKRNFNPEPTKDETVSSKEAFERIKAARESVSNFTLKVDGAGRVGGFGLVEQPEFKVEADHFEIKTPNGNEPLFKAEAGRIMLNHGVIDFAQIEAATVGTNGPISGMVKLLIPIEGTDKHVLADIHTGGSFPAGSFGISIPADAFRNPR